MKCRQARCKRAQSASSFFLPLASNLRSSPRLFWITELASPLWHFHRLPLSLHIPDVTSPRQYGLYATLRRGPESCRRSSCVHLGAMLRLYHRRGGSNVLSCTADEESVVGRLVYTCSLGRSSPLCLHIVLRILLAPLDLFSFLGRRSSNDTDKPLSIHRSSMSPFLSPGSSTQIKATPATSSTSPQDN